MFKSVIITKITALVMLLTLVLTPVTIGMTHGPGPVGSEITEHGHSHDIANISIGRTLPPWPNHDATDHEHPTPALLAGAQTILISLVQTPEPVPYRLHNSDAREGLKRPPRLNVR